MSDVSNRSIALIIPDFDHGGEEKRVVFFANNYLNYFKEVYLFAPYGKSDVLLDKRVNRIVIDTRKFFNIPRILSIIKENKIEVLQGHKRATLPVLFLAEKILKIKSVFNFDNIYPKFNFACKFISPGHIVYLSEIVKDFYLPYYRNKMNVTINMGGDFYRRYNSAQIQELKKDFDVEGQFVFLSLGRLSEQKNHRMLLGALHNIKEKDFCCLVVGSGPLEDELRRLSIKYSLGNKVRFLGHRIDIEELLNVSNVLLQTSFFEGFPNVFIEATSVGVPIVSTEVGSSKTLIKDNGILVPSGDQAKFSEALERIIKEYALYKDASIKMQESDFFKQFHKDKMLQNYIAFYQDLLQSGNSLN